ncbi:hypothetical protein GCM10020358_29850 [Amorphoplanes nipponensis]|uniref:hypothetical protein n=1 Tax=Actinoplanes nipponensis TaxID=135950 RepID=UPI0031E5059E
MLDQPWRDRAGFCGVEVLDQPSGPIALTQRAHLRALAVRIKIVHDLLAAFADEHTPFPVELLAAQTGSWSPSGCCSSATRLATRARTWRPGCSPTRRPGATTSGCCRSAGRAGPPPLHVIAAALRETVEILEPMLPGLRAPDVRNVYFQLAASSRRQLRIVQAWSDR